jgi:hypothetical protein
MKIKYLPAGFVVPAQPIKASKPPFGPDWVHEIKHDGYYRMIVRRDGPTVRLYTRNAHDWTARLPAIAAAAERIGPRASRSMARPLWWGLTAFPDSTTYGGGRPRIARCCTPSI